MAGTALELPEGGLDDGIVAVEEYRADDAPLLAAGARDPEVVRFAAVRWGSDSPEQLAHRIEHTWPALAAMGDVLSASIRHSTSDQLLGHVVLFNVDRRRGTCDVGFWLLRNARGRGVSGRALDLVCRWAFDELGLARVQASTDMENVAAQRTLEKASFQREGVLRSFHPAPSGGRVDHFLYSRLPTD